MSIQEAVSLPSTGADTLWCVAQASEGRHQVEVCDGDDADTLWKMGFDHLLADVVLHFEVCSDSTVSIADGMYLSASE